MKSLRFAELGQLAIYLSQVVEACGGLGMFGTKDLFVDLQRALIERFRFREVAGVCTKERQIIETLCRVRMFGAESLLIDFQCALKQLFSLGGIPHGAVKRSA